MCESTPTIAPESRKTLHVAVGVITDASGRILIAKRPEHVHQGGLWEFPGGKVEPGESLLQALDRELFEELDIRVLATQPVIEIVHDYGDKIVRLDVHRVNHFSGMPTGKEGQPLAWVQRDQLPDYAFPAANYPIIQALTLPSVLWITGRFVSDDDFLSRVQAGLDRGASLVQLRAHDLADDHYFTLASQALALCNNSGARLLLNRRHTGSEILRAKVPAHGIHLGAEQLACLQGRPDAPLVGASCHTLQALQRAAALGLDYVTLSPVKATSSHPDAAPMGWSRFGELVAQAKLPVYALGGMEAGDDMDTARALGGQGVAAISAWWGD